YTLADGNQKWKWTGDSPAYASPTIMTIDGAKLIIAETQRKLVAINLADGKQVWEMPFSTRYNASGPVVEGNVIYISAAAGGGMGGGMRGPGGGGGAGRGGGGGPGGPGGGRGGGGGGRMGGGMGGGFGNVVDAGSVLLALTPSAEMVVVQPGDKYTEVAKIKVSEGQTHAYPIAS